MEEIRGDKRLEEDAIVSENIEINIGKAKKFLEKNKNLVTYVILAFITFVGVYIRTRNISKLTDVTTGTWTLGPDLDPFLFLRWANEIVANGSLAPIDIMRYVPL